MYKVHIQATNCMLEQTLRAAVISCDKAAQVAAVAADSR